MDKSSPGGFISVAVKAVLAAVAAVLVSVSLLAGTALAATSYTHNQSYSYAGLYRDPSTKNSIVIWNEYNDQAVTMLCFTDAEYVTDRNYSNYNSARWYRIRDAGGRVGYIHSSYVYYQTTVGHC